MVFSRIKIQYKRLTCIQERERAVQNTASVTQHAELVERINQLSILRESNATLRAEHESSTKKVRILEAKLKQLSGELNPAKEEAQSAIAELEATKVQMQHLKQETLRWQERNVPLLTKVKYSLVILTQNLIAFCSSMTVSIQQRYRLLRTKFRNGRKRPLLHSRRSLRRKQK